RRAGGGGRGLPLPRAGGQSRRHADPRRHRGARRADRDAAHRRGDAGGRHPLADRHRGPDGMSLRAAFAYAGLVLRLNLRNPMAMIYGYLFPLVFLAAFAILYRHDAVPVLLHLGELLTVTALGGACFGLPTAIVAERERGVWRRYRASPQGAVTFVAGQAASRLILLAGAAVLQIAAAMTVLDR